MDVIIIIGGIVMQVIKTGKKIIGTQQVTCRKCEAILEIEAKDLTLYDKPYKSSYYFTCPCCSRAQLIYRDDLSEDIIFDLDHNH